MPHFPIQIVDEKDQLIGGSSVVDAYEKGLWHRVVRIMVEDNQGKVLLQKRASTMRTYPNCWDNSAAGHVDEGETYDQAASRELAEEIGLNKAPLKEVGIYKTSVHLGGKQINRFNKLYKTVAQSNRQFKLQEEEVSKVQWFTVDEVRKLIADNPEIVTDGLVDVFTRYYP